MADLKGPLFDGRAKQATFEMCLDIERTGADEAERLVLGRLAQVLQNPTGYYESRITTEPSAEGAVVTDQGVVYGPWLEGIGSRNKDTRFKGYATFRRVGQMMAARMPFIARQVAKPYVKRMGS
jgi:hypothetical protein